MLNCGQTPYTGVWLLLKVRSPNDKPDASGFLWSQSSANEGKRKLLTSSNWTVYAPMWCCQSFDSNLNVSHIQIQIQSSEFSPYNFCLCDENSLLWIWICFKFKFESKIVTTSHGCVHSPIATHRLVFDLIKFWRTESPFSSAVLSLPHSQHHDVRESMLLISPRPSRRGAG